MRFTKTPVEGTFVVDLEPHVDDRGSFARAFCAEEFHQAGIAFEVAQVNLSGTVQAGTIRGLHYIEQPPEQKFVRCVRGAVLDVIIDMRAGSPTRYVTHVVELDERGGRALFVPAGVAHGYQTLVDNVQFLYLTDFVFRPGLERGVRFDDPALEVTWPLPVSVVADRDRAWPLIPPR